MKIIAYNIKRIVVLNDSGFIFIIKVFYRGHFLTKIFLLMFIFLRYL